MEYLWERALRKCRKRTELAELLTWKSPEAWSLSTVLLNPPHSQQNLGRFGSCLQTLIQLWRTERWVPWWSRPLGFLWTATILTANVVCCPLALLQCGVYSLAPDTLIQNYGCVQLCFCSWAALNNQRGVSYCFVNTGLGPVVEWRSGYKLSYNTKQWPGPGFTFGHIVPSQGEISSCLDAESAETLGISKDFCFPSPSNLETGSNFFAALASGSHGLPAEICNRRLATVLGVFCDSENWPRKEGAETYHAHFMRDPGGTCNQRSFLPKCNSQSQSSKGGRGMQWKHLM